MGYYICLLVETITTLHKGTTTTYYNILYNYTTMIVISNKTNTILSTILHNYTALEVKLTFLPTHYMP
jgi:hypothetical protein